MDLHWSLDELYTSLDSPEYKNDLEELKKDIASLTAWAAQNLNSYEDAAKKVDYFVKAINKIEAYDKLTSYSWLRLSINSEDSEALKALNVAEDIYTDLSGALAAFKAYIKGIDDLEAIIASSSFLKEHQFYLQEQKLEASYMLSQEEEILFSKLKTTGSNAWGKLVEQLTGTHLVDVSKELDPSGVLTLPVVRNMAYSADKAVRKAAFEAEVASYSKIEKPVAAALNAIKGEAITAAKMRGYDSVLDMTVKNSRMEMEALDSMLSAIRDSLPAFRRYFKHKATLMGDPNGLAYYNVQAPVGDADMKFTYEEAADYVVKNFASFSNKLGDFARYAFDHRWLDVEPRKGKVGGAFCSTIHSIKQSRILSNFSESFESVLTLAHELGHGYHSYCLKDASFLNCDYSMPIAETASTFCETLVCNAAIKEATPAEKFLILESSISGAAQVIVDIYSRFLFEDEVIRRREEGPLSVDELKQIMIDSEKASYGDGIDQSMLHPYMWICKGHYYRAERNYYNFPYAYGHLFSTGLYGLYLEQGDSFIQKYDELLEATGKSSLRDVGRMVGIDVHEKAFWAKSLKLIEKDIDEFISIKL